MSRGISLANKCLMLFGCAVVVILIGALSVPWLRTSALVQDYQLEVSRQLADAWLQASIRVPDAVLRSEAFVEASQRSPGSSQGTGDLRLSFIPIGEIETDEEVSSFLTNAMAAFAADPEKLEYTATDRRQGASWYMYARAIRQSLMRSVQDHAAADFSAGASEPSLTDPIAAVLIVERRSVFGESQLLTSRAWIIAAGVIASILAVLVFYLILTRVIFTPVRALRETTERVQRGELTARSTLTTGDEFEELSTAFNAMLDEMDLTQRHLRTMNENLDLKVTELAEANVGLWESSRFKSEFLANVSHELRTPLNSIIGFAEVIRERASEDEKLQRYATNIQTSGRSLLDMINELLDVAKIEAGRMEVSIESVNVADLCRGLLAIMRPQADAAGVSLHARVFDDLPIIETDAGKLQQILYNLLSNAVKFTPRGGQVTLGADLIDDETTDTIRLSVTDTGPGIAEDMQEMIFEKFRQADASHTREQGGTGLGLAICRELATMLKGEVTVMSTPGRGATFLVNLPLCFASDDLPPLMGVV
jgi:two-component system sensor histidine kinase BarA